jgi:peptidyl-prolyl cis-trans isomerase D
MLQYIHDKLSGKLAYILLGALALVFSVWGVQGIVSFSAKREAGMRVNGEDIDTERVRRAYQDQIAQISRAFKGDLPAPIKARVEQQVTDQFVAVTLLSQQSQKQGYTVSDADVVRAIQGEQAFQVDGKFDRDSYLGRLRMLGYTPTMFEAEERKDLRDRQIEAGIRLSAFATEPELKRLAALENETRTIGYAAIPAAKFLPTVHADAAAIQAYYEGHKSEYMTPDTVTLSYLALRLEDLAAQVAVTDAELQGFYDQVKDRYVEAEKRQARHILIEGSDDAARAQAESVYKEATAPGADFAELAKKYSKDPGSAAKGGDLGWAERSTFVPSFAEALFAMQPGEIRGPIKSQFGWHIIKLEGIQAGKAKSLADVKPQLEAEYRRNEAEKRFGDAQEKLDQLVFENSGSLQPAASALGLKIGQIADFTRTGGGAPFGADPKLIESAFAADVLAGQNSRALELKPGLVVAIRASNRREPALRPLTEVRAQVETAVNEGLAAKAAQDAANALSAALLAGKPWSEALKPLGATHAPDTEQEKAPPNLVVFQPAISMTRIQTGVPRAVTTSAFQAAHPQGGKPSVGSVALLKGDVAVYAVDAVQPGVPGKDASSQAQRIAQASAVGEITAYVQTLKAAASIHTNPQLFE